MYAPKETSSLMTVYVHDNPLSGSIHVSAHVHLATDMIAINAINRTVVIIVSRIYTAFSQLHLNYSMLSHAKMQKKKRGEP